MKDHDGEGDGTALFKAAQPVLAWSLDSSE